MTTLAFWHHCFSQLGSSESPSKAIESKKIWRIGLQGLQDTLGRWIWKCSSGAWCSRENAGNSAATFLRERRADVSKQVQRLERWEDVCNGKMLVRLRTSTQITKWHLVGVDPYRRRDPYKAAAGPWQILQTSLGLLGSPATHTGWLRG